MEKTWSHRGSYFCPFLLIPAAGDGMDTTALPVPIIAGIVVGFLLTLAAIFALIYWKQLRARR